MNKKRFAPCCDEMRQGMYRGGCVPGISNDYPPILISCDDDLRGLPIRYCPWCGKAIIPSEEKTEEKGL